MNLLDIFDGCLFGHVDRLANRAGQEWLNRPHHPNVTSVVDGVIAHRAGEDCFVLFLESWRAQDGLFDVDVVNDGFDLSLGVTKNLKSTRYGLVDDVHRATADQLLNFD